MGPAPPGKDFDAIVWLDEVCRRLATSADHLKELIDQGHYPQLRGVGNRLFYTEGDMAVIANYAGRWGPRKSTEKYGETPEKSGRTRKDTGSQDQA